MSLFACTYDDVISVASTVSSLLTNTLESVEKDRISLHLPTPVLHEVQPSLPAFVDWTTVTSDDDHGWMYKTLKGDQRSTSDMAKDCLHIIWPADGF